MNFRVHQLFCFKGGNRMNYSNQYYGNYTPTYYQPYTYPYQSPYTQIQNQPIQNTNNNTSMGNLIQNTVQHDFVGNFVKSYDEVRNINPDQTMVFLDKENRKIFTDSFQGFPGPLLRFS